MPKHYSIDQLAAITAQRAQSAMATMRSETRDLRQNSAGLGGGIYAPKIKTPRKKTKKTMETSVLAEIIGSSASAAQTASKLLATLLAGQRIG